MFTSSWQVTDSESTLLRLVLQEGEPGFPLPTGHPLSCRAWQGHPRAAPSTEAGAFRGQQGLPGVWGKRAHGEWCCSS